MKGLINTINMHYAMSKVEVQTSNLDEHALEGVFVILSQIRGTVAHTQQACYPCM